MKKIGSLVAVIVLVAGFAVAWQSQSVAESGPTADTPTIAKTADGAGCESAAKASCDKADKTGGCPFSAQPAAVTASEKSGCPSESVSLASFTGAAEGKAGCPKADKAAGCEKKCCEESGEKCCEKGECPKKCCEGENEKCDKAANCPKKTGDGSACNKAGDKAACGVKAESASAKAGCAASPTETARPVAVAKSNNCSAQVSLAADSGQKSEKKSGCCPKKATASLAAATQPAAMPAGQSNGCNAPKSTLVSAAAEQ